MHPITLDVLKLIFERSMIAFEAQCLFGYNNLSSIVVMICVSSCAPFEIYRRLCNPPLHLAAAEAYHNGMHMLAYWMNRADTKKRRWKICIRI